MLLIQPRYSTFLKTMQTLFVDYCMLLLASLIMLSLQMISHLSEMYSIWNKLHSSSLSVPTIIPYELK